jgi:fructokinase
MITRVGVDDYGKEVLRRFGEGGLPLNLTQIDPASATGTVDVTLSSDGIPFFTIHEPVAWDNLQATDEALTAVRRAEAICFGTLAQRGPISRATVQALAAAAQEEAWRVFDLNLRQTYFSREVIERSLALANVLKLNEDELAVLAQLFAVPGGAKEQVEQLAGAYSLRVVALTRGPRGSLLFQGGRWSDYQPAPVAVVDTVGAGDAFTAALTLGLLGKMDIDEINRLANEVARYVCSQAGATPPLPAAFAEAIKGRR